MILATEALARLEEGNRRFVSGKNDTESESRRQKLETLANAQKPFAIILGCSDSRVPAELVFDQGLGDLFVIRVAGNIVAPSQVGSIEFAAERYESQLVVVLGHSSCGAVLATLEQLENPDLKQHSRGVRSIVERIVPAVQTLVETGIPHDELLKHSVRANIRASVSHLKHASETLENLINGGLRIVGAEYSLETGEVDFFDADLR